MSGGTVRTTAIIGMLLAGVLALAGCNHTSNTPGNAPPSNSQGGGY